MLRLPLVGGKEGVRSGGGGGAAVGTGAPRCQNRCPYVMVLFMEHTVINVTDMNVEVGNEVEVSSPSPKGR